MKTVRLISRFLSARIVLCATRRCAVLALAIAGAVVVDSARAQAVCAEVKIEIQQKLNIERQGFIATMRIVNGLETTALTNIGVNVKFSDRNGDGVRATSNPDDTSALFFVREDLLSGIDGGVQGAGVIQPKTSGEARWLIIPSAGAGGETAAGEIYAVGATLTYQEGDEVRTVEVTPEVITVRPQPRLELDYFLPRDVYADDPFTPETEPSEPFTLGVRVKNAGAGPANKVSIESAQPRIIENVQGLLIGFQIDGSYVQDQPTQNTLQIDFGDIAPNRTKAGRWVMSTTLSGRFSEFAAEYTHDDALGGAVTSLLQRVTTHTLLKDVRVDLPGRDGIRDFLALDGDVVRVYETDGLDSEVVNQSASATLMPATAGALDLVFPAMPTASFVKIPDPSGGQFQIGWVERSDGKVLAAENTWKSRERTESGTGWRHYLNLFDIGGSGRYRLNAANPVQFGTLGGFVYLDANRDGQRNETEQGLAAVVVTLEGVAPSGEPIRQLAGTDAAGAFRFNDQLPGTYALIVGVAEGYVDGTHAAGSGGGIVSVDRIDGIVIGAGATAAGYAFAKEPIVQPSSADLTAAASFADTEVEVGTIVTATVRVTNLGPDATGAALVWQLPPGLVVNSATSASGTIDVAQARWTLSSIADDVSAELVLQLQASSAGSSALQVSVVGSAIDPVAANNAASAVLQVYEPEPGQPSVLQELNRLPRVLALVTCSTGTGVDAACTNARTSRLSALLAGLGVEHTVVTSSLAYRESLRSGRYNVHWISGGSSPMIEQLAEELRNALRRGEGVLIDGVHDSRSAIIDQSIGVSYAGALTPAPGAVTTAPGIFAAGIQLETTAATYALDTTSATVEARFASGDEAILSARVGEGRSLIFAFELIESAAAVGGGAQSWSSLLETALIWLTKEPGSTQVGREFVPVSTRISNPLDRDATIDLQLMFDPGTTLATSAVPLASGSTTDAPKWSIVVPAGGQRWLEVGLRVPVTAGVSGLRTLATWRKVSGDVVLFDQRLDLRIDGAANRIETVLAGLRALSLSDPAQMAQRDAALAAIERARSALSDNKPASALSDLVVAEGSLSLLAQAQPTVPLLAVSNVVKEASARWHALNPLCGSASIAGVTVDAATFWPFAVNERLEVQGGRPGNSDWEWAVGTNTNSKQHRAEYAAFNWISGRTYVWQLEYHTNGSATLTVRDGASSLFTTRFTPRQAPGMRSGTAVRVSAALNNSAPDTPILVTLDRVNGAPASAILQAGVTPRRDGSTAVYFPAMAAGMTLQGSIQLTFTGSTPPDRAKLNVQVHAGEVACSPELVR
ncbi:MAG: hypothetical protein HYV17_10840 [Xanthomonadales bacterium]|nr:hypothetical protein [Xanthomonadales bacterium]